ncbi:MAG: DNA polymerase domain-containing protein, partial [Thermoplasmata archaeon]
HEGIVEVDYASLYPQIMRTFNISPETIFCPCCKEDGMVAPTIGHYTCVRRRGLIPVYLDPVLERKAYYKRKKKEPGPSQEIYEARDSILKWMLVTCYDGSTLVPYKERGIAKIAPISKIIDGAIPGGPGIVPPSEEICVYGLDQQLNVVEKPVRKLIKSPTPEKMLRISLVGGRELLVTPNHRFFIQTDAEWERKRADALEVGDQIPVARNWEPDVAYPAKSLNAAYVLSRNQDLKDLECWRVRGPSLRARMRSHFRDVKQHASNAGYAPRSPHIWKETGVVPLRFLPLLRLPLTSWDLLEIAHGRRHGGPLNFIPARIEIDDDLGFLVGFFMGDGSGTGNMIRLYVGMDESELVGKLLDIVDKKFGVIGVVRKETHARMWVVQFNSSGLKRIFRDVLHVGPSVRKGKLGVPDWLLNASEDARRGFVAGLIASDGSIHPKGKAIIASAYRPFLERVRLLLGTLGIPSHTYSHKNREHTMHTVQFPIAYLDGVWLKDFHRSKLEAFPPPAFQKKDGSVLFYAIRSIERVRPQSRFVYCFEVDDQPRGFLVEGMVFASNSFGYLGYSNARYGRIECHEAINAYARELLVRSVHIAEAHGYEVIHGIVDSLWLRPLPGHAPVDEVVQRIQDDIGLPLDLEGTYHWIVFLPCKTTGVGALNRYYGLFEDGEMKLRGIEVRRHDTTPFVAQAQTGMLEVFRQARNAQEFQDAIPAAVQVLREAAADLRNGDVPLEDLVISKVVTKPLEEYVVLNYTAAALRQLRARGFKTEPGEYVRYIIMNRKSRDYRQKVKFAAFLRDGDTPDVWEYLRLLARSGETLLAPFGYTEENLLQELQET